jgi:hypothetical protein
MNLRDYGPCGACGKYVLLTSGCHHWKPNLQRGNFRQRKRDRNKAYKAKLKAQFDLPAIPGMIDPGTTE